VAPRARRHRLPRRRMVVRSAPGGVPRRVSGPERRREVPAAPGRAAALGHSDMSRYEPAIDLAAITAIDVHVHIEVGAHGEASLPEDLVAATAKYFSTDGPNPDLDGVAAYYRERRMAAVVFSVDAETQLGHPAISSAEIAEGAARNSDVLIPFGS